MKVHRTHLLRQRIVEEQHRLEEAKRGIVMQRCADDNDMASCYESTHAGIILMQHARNRLHYLQQRMTAIENRPQALCMDCGEEISAQRLAAVPDAMRCAVCQADWEEGQRRVQFQKASCCFELQHS